jgi:hypothetical protein
MFDCFFGVSGGKIDPWFGRGHGKIGMPRRAGRFDRASSIGYYHFAGWSSLVARRAHNPEVVGSNPTPATSYLLKSKGLPDFHIGSPFTFSA